MSVQTTPSTSRRETAQHPVAEHVTDATSAKEHLLVRYRAVRRTTERLIEPLSDEDCAVQSMPDASPAKWHLAHTTWFFETFVLERELPDYCRFDDRFGFLFNSYYNSVGPMHPRPMRGLLTRPPLCEVRAYREHVDTAIDHWLSGDEPTRSALAVLETGLHHEAQHQELLLTDIKHAFSCNPLEPAYRMRSPYATERPDGGFCWIDGPVGICTIGHAGSTFGFDNELPRHRVFLEPHALASHPVTNAEYRSFIEDGGYQRPELWLSEGWQAVNTHGWHGPSYWRRRDGEWYEFTLSGPQPIDDAAPVSHVSYYEADAFARWRGARLPTEAEWEMAAAGRPVEGNFLESERLHTSPPEPIATQDGKGALYGLFGDVWEWSASPYTPYPGFRAPAGALGEYNGKFMSNQMVLRGGSCASPRFHIRASYRNFFPPDARWQFSGFRLARDGATS